MKKSNKHYICHGTYFIITLVKEGVAGSWRHINYDLKLIFHASGLNIFKTFVFSNTLPSQEYTMNSFKNIL
jgi:hypothetical protein